MFGILPISVVSAAPTAATLFCFMASQAPAGLNRGRVIRPKSSNFTSTRHVELQRLGRLRAIHDIGHHLRPFGQLHHRDGMGLRAPMSWARAVVDHIAPEHALAGGLEDLDVAGAALGAERAGRKVGVGAIRRSTLQQQLLAGLAAVPEMLGLRRRLRENSIHGFVKSLRKIVNAEPSWASLAALSRRHLAEGGGEASARRRCAQACRPC